MPLFQIETRINNFIKDGTQEKLRFEPMDKTQRAIVYVFMFFHLFIDN